MNEIVRKHHVDRAWDRVMVQVRAEIQQRQLHPARVVLLLPYAQLMQEARAAWLRGLESLPTQAQASSMPRFETTMSWASGLHEFEPGVDDLQLDAAPDLLTAANLLARAGLKAHQGLLAEPLLQAAWSLAAAACAVAPMARPQWGTRLADELTNGMASPLFALEVALERIALAWAASSSYPSDPVFAAAPDLLVLLTGFQTEPIGLALKQSLRERLIVLPLVLPLEAHEADHGTGQVALHVGADAEDEAQCAAACVLTHLAAGRTPVALVAQDRFLTRRVHAMLSQRGVAVRDETGWKLSTTRAAASLMSLLRAGVWDASADALLDWLKGAPAFDATVVAQAESSWRRRGVRDWRSAPTEDVVAGLLQQVQTLLGTLKTARPLARWLFDLRASLQSAGQWPDLSHDAAGQAVLAALRLCEGAELEFANVTARMTQSEFIVWVSQTLEAVNFLPDRHAKERSDQVVILPLSQLLGRPLAAVVLPGCDELRLPACPEPTGLWSPAQRLLLGLSTREQLAAMTRACWQYALQFPYIDILWRVSEGGESLMASGLVQEWQLNHSPVLAPDQRVLRALTAQPCVMPRPRGDALPVTRLSSSAYEDLRRCPYRFFAMRQLKLQEFDELDVELDKRDFGSWLHHLLRLFHETLSQAPVSDYDARLVRMNEAAQQATLALGLSNSDFLPFAAAWPRLRTLYLQWLAEHEASGAIFSQAESWRETPLGRLTLVGKIDRLDRLVDGTSLVIDYKTEPRSTTARRIKAPLEDTQLAFYAALLADDTLAAAYVNVGEKDATRSYFQTDIVGLRDQLIEGVTADMSRIEAGTPMAALGEGKACEFCAARGLCRKDFWE